MIDLRKQSRLFAAASVLALAACQSPKPEFSGNPLFQDPLTADPCALVYNDTVYLFTGSDEIPPGEDGFRMTKWYAFSSPDMAHWTNQGVKLTVDDFDWASHNAFAGHVVENHGKFWWYVPMILKDTTAITHEGFGIGVAVADHPLGPYKDALGGPIICDTTQNAIVLNIDPAVYVDDDGQVYMYWGSWNEARYVKLKENMIETDGPVQTVDAKNFFEAPWIHKKGDTYYFSYAAHYPSTTEYSSSKSITGPWEYQGVINDTIANSPTNHQAIISFKGQDYIFYHNADTPTGGPFRRSVCVDSLNYDANGKIQKVVRTKTGVPAVQ